jgi:hypothetical protein
MVLKKVVEGDPVIKLTKRKMTAREREELLIENFVGLQQAMTNLSIKFGGLSDNISKLLEIFEDAARSFIKDGKNGDNEMLNKINTLVDQNKTIARGLVLMEGKLSAPSSNHQINSETSSIPSDHGLSNKPPRPKPLPT